MTWDYEKTEYEKQAQSDPVWHLERLINYGLGGEKLNRETLKRYLPALKIPENRRVFLNLILYGKRNSE